MDHAIFPGLGLYCFANRLSLGILVLWSYLGDGDSTYTISVPRIFRRKD